MRSAFSANTRQLLTLGVVFAAHALGHFLMYRGAVTSRAWLFQSDLLNMLMPAAAAFTLYFLVLRFKAGRQHGAGIASALFFSFLLTAFSGLAGMTAAFNTYGS